MSYIKRRADDRKPGDKQLYSASPVIEMDICVGDIGAEDVQRRGQPRSALFGRAAELHSGRLSGALATKG